MSQQNCNVKECKNEGHYWRICGHANAKADKQNKIKPRSEKMDKLMKKDYVPQVKEMVAEGTPCSLQVKPGEICTGKAQGFHHPFGKHSDELRLTNKVPACNACNTWVEKHDAEARAMGLKKSKFSIPAKNQKIKRA